jgi:hypothetical protein
MHRHQGSAGHSRSVSHSLWHDPLLGGGAASLGRGSPSRLGSLLKGEERAITSTLMGEAKVMAALRANRAARAPLLGAFARLRRSDRAGWGWKCEGGYGRRSRRGLTHTARALIFGSMSGGPFRQPQIIVDLQSARPRAKPKYLPSRNAVSALIALAVHNFVDAVGRYIDIPCQRIHAHAEGFMNSSDRISPANRIRQLRAMRSFK